MVLHGAESALPRKADRADLDYYIHYKLNKRGVGLGIFDPRAFAEYARCTTAEQIHAVCEDYRATVTLDFAMDKADHEGGTAHRLSGSGAVGVQQPRGPASQADEALGRWTTDYRGYAIPTGHYPAEERPDLVAPALLLDFFSGIEPRTP